MPCPGPTSPRRQFPVPLAESPVLSSRSNWARLPVEASGRWALALLPAMIAVLALAAPAAAQDVSTHFWPEVDTFVKLNDRMRLFVPIADTRTGEDDSAQNGTTGVYFDYYTKALLEAGVSANDARSSLLLLRVGYAYSAPGSGESATNTIVGEATGRVVIPWKILLSHRSRFDLNFSGGEFSPVYRSRARLERDVVIGKNFLTPYAYGEVFYSFNDGTWTRVRVAGGVEVHIWERFVPEVYFQRDYNKAAGTDVNGFGLVLSIYLR